MASTTHPVPIHALDQDIFWFQVSMNDLLAMKEPDASIYNKNRWNRA